MSVTTPMKSRRHVLVLGVARTLVGFRGPLIRAMLAEGHRVTAVSDEYHPEMAETLAAWGADFRTVSLARTGRNPLSDLASLYELVALMRAVRPDVFFGYTIKPATLGVLAARLAGVKRRVAMIAGLGYAFTEGGGPARAMVRFAAETLCRQTLRFADRVIFQNPDDEKFFVEHGFVSESKAARVAGSGVELDHYAPAPLPDGPLTFVLLARLLRDKGVGEYAAAARIVKSRYPETRFLLAGAVDPNPTSITHAEVEAWTRDGTIEWLGQVNDVRQCIAQAHVGVLPSYREGIPRSILEIMSMGRAVVTTDAPGCRETVVPGLNGFLVPLRDAGAVAEAMLRFAAEPGLAARFGSQSRRIAKQRFDVHDVNARMLELLGLAEAQSEVSTGPMSFGQAAVVVSR